MASQPVIVQGTRARVGPSPFALLMSESWKVVLPKAADAANAADAAARWAGFGGPRHAGRVDEWRCGFALVGQFPTF